MFIQIPFHSTSFNPPPCSGSLPRFTATAVMQLGLIFFVNHCRMLENPRFIQHGHSLQETPKDVVAKWSELVTTFWFLFAVKDSPVKIRTYSVEYKPNETIKLTHQMFPSCNTKTSRSESRSLLYMLFKNFKSQPQPQQGVSYTIFSTQDQMLSWFQLKCDKRCWQSWSHFIYSLCR